MLLLTSSIDHPVCLDGALWSADIPGSIRVQFQTSDWSILVDSSTVVSGSYGQGLG